MAMDNIRIKFEKTAVCRNRVMVPGDELTVDAKTADRMVERNLAIVVGEEPSDEAQTADELTGMTVDELKEYAVEAGVDLTGKTKKDDIIAAIREAV